MGVKCGPGGPLQQFQNQHGGRIVAQVAHLQPDKYRGQIVAHLENVLVTLETITQQYFKQASTLNVCMTHAHQTGDGKHDFWFGCGVAGHTTCVGFVQRGVGPPLPGRWSGPLGVPDLPLRAPTPM